MNRRLERMEIECCFTEWYSLSCPYSIVLQVISSARMFVIWHCLCWWVSLLCSLSNAATSTWSSKPMPVTCWSFTRMKNAWNQKEPFSWTLLSTFARFVNAVWLCCVQFVYCVISKWYLVWRVLWRPCWEVLYAVRFTTIWPFRLCHSPQLFTV